MTAITSTNGPSANATGDLSPPAIVADGTFVGSSSVVSRLKAIAARVAQRPSTVMLLGETGTGKEMLARFIHSNSQRADKAFIPVDCTAFSDNLFESQLFGHVKGAFTGAHRDTLGFIRSADGGTLFLDEIGELNLNLQAKLLRVIQERRVVPVGDAIPKAVDIRVICATHRNLPEMVQAGTFRQDLFFRLQVFTLSLPPLRDRADDLPQLSEFFLERLAELGGDTPKKLSGEAIEALLRHTWPGNVRELFNVLEHAWVLADGHSIQVSDLPAPLSTGGYRPYHPSDLNLESLERRVIIEALKRSQYNRTAACKLLGLELRRLNRRIVSLKIDLPKRSSLPSQ